MVGTLANTETQIDDAFFADILAAINSTEQPSPEKMLPNREPINIWQKLNTLIERGICFHPTADKFQIENAHLATVEDLEFLRNYSSGILCVLQQALLAKCIFNDAPTFLEDFRHEIAERELLMSGDAEEVSNETRERAVSKLPNRGLPTFLRSICEFIVAL